MVPFSVTSNPDFKVMIFLTSNNLTTVQDKAIITNTTVGQSSPIFLIRFFYDWRPGSCCGWTCNQLTSKVDGGITGSRLRWSIPTIRQPFLTFVGNSGLYWTIFAWNRDTVVPAEGNGDLQTLICILVARLRRCLTLTNPVPWQNWMAAYSGCALQMKTLCSGWPMMVHDTHTRRRRMEE